MTEDVYLNLLFDKFMELTGPCFNYDLVMTYDVQTSVWTLYSLVNNFNISMKLSDMIPVIDIVNKTDGYTSVDFMLTLSNNESLTFYDNEYEKWDYNNKEARNAFVKNFGIC
ncbi:hypothetical protein FDI40_gp343 [Agrobacterium phage Atu_ph07]|uniref:Uncharacterized protein n=1 Tax=Agrobacterium phage Atu_ph07 TaxID=2024264 RepID=A0A2L0UZV3_9CAUD|nr:hypothetical protein FDI40_gp343 [Agrobacterium phage Atu_ph07]AUZ95102.1 hypothetical protein [Agrobacterium phage Atu_ph07]